MRDGYSNPFVALRAGVQLALPATERLPEAGHLWSKSEIDALIFAWAARRPLLVRGEAGSGKSQIARAAAEVLGSSPPLIEVIHPRFEALDLLYTVDLVTRLADAQIEGKLDPTNERYVAPGILWRAFERLRLGDAHPVVLIDEIDKADSDLPNALLDVLGNRSFAVPPLGPDVVQAAPEGRLPLIVMTTNEERELPPAFVRRCAVLNLNPPESGVDSWLVDRGKVHEHLDIEPGVRAEAARQVVRDRDDAIREGYPSVGLAEYIDLLTALDDLTRSLPESERNGAQRDWLKRISPYALIKHAGQQQLEAEELEMVQERDGAV